VHDQTNTDQRFAELEDLHCADCGDDVADELDGFQHVDGSALCNGDVVEVTA